MAKFLDIEIEELREILGHETRSKYGTYYFRCPECAKYGKDTKGDNLVFNSSNGKLRCFACGEGQLTALRMINEHRQKTGYWKQSHKKEEVKEEPKQTWYELNKDELLMYMCEASEELLAAEPVVEWLEQKHGINRTTIKDCGIGLDEDKNAVCFPIFSMTHEQMLVGFEYRLLGDKKQIWRTPQAPSCLAGIWGKTCAKNVIICEGYVDSYCFKQFLESKNKLDDFLILTPANGCNDIIRHIPDIDFSKFKSCYLLLDNDEAGNRATNEILENYPFFIDKRASLIKNNVNDFKELYFLKYL